MIMVLLYSEDFRTRDIYLDYPFEDVKFRWDKQTKKVYRRYYGKKEDEVDHSSDMFNQAIAAGTEITRDEYYRD
jgi:hypothetical protein